MTFDDKKKSEERTFLVAIDFSDCSREALRWTKSFLAQKPSHIIALHVIDSNFVTECICQKLGDEGPIKKKLFIEAKAKLRDFLKQENMGEEH
ncbi:MAG TPA: hypothetical protein DCY53_06630, partial [Desulfobacteraceae bacterium]|nr:hypothetical protein [Desulfobacteraceae bacterium]